MHKRIILITAIVATVAAVAVPFAAADTNHGQPSCTAPPLDEAANGSRDGWDHAHLQNASFPGALAELEGYLNVCRTNDNPVIEGASASGRVVRAAGVVKAQLRAQLQQWRDTDPAPGFQGTWVTVDQSASVNTGNNRTLTVTTPFHTVNQPADALTQGWTRVNVRALIRWGSASGPLTFHVQPTYPIWVDDGPISPAVPPV